MSVTIEPAPSGRAKCRACGRAIARGELRLGERAPNPFGDGEATYWFHLECGARKRPEAAIEALAACTSLPTDAMELRSLAAVGQAHPRLARVAGAHRSPSARARCRHCRQQIEHGSVRIALDIWEEGRFGGAGYVHPSCAAEYFGAIDDLPTRVTRCAPEIDPSVLAELIADLRGTGPG